MPNPKIIDDDRDTISAVYNDKQVRSWEYHSEDERRMKMRMAREWQEGFLHAMQIVSERSRQRAREMNAELPPEQADVMRLKGMI